MQCFLLGIIVEIGDPFVVGAFDIRVFGCLFGFHLGFVLLVRFHQMFVPEYSLGASLRVTSIAGLCILSSLIVNLLSLFIRGVRYCFVLEQNHVNHYVFLLLYFVAVTTRVMAMTMLRNCILFSVNNQIQRSDFKVGMDISRRREKPP